MKKTNRTHKILSGMLISTVLFTGLGFAEPLRLRNEHSPEMMSAIQELKKDPSSLQVAPASGFVSESFKGRSGKLIIHIQDAHTNVSGQKNLAAVLEEMIKEYGVDLFFVEGGSGDDSLSFLRTYASPEVRNRVAMRFLERGEISGEEYLDIVSDQPFLLWGVEDPDLYSRSLEIYAKIAEIRDEATAGVQEIQRKVKRLQSKMYSTKLSRFERKAKAFQETKENYDEYAVLLIRKASEMGVNLEAYPVLRRFHEAMNLEDSLDLKQADMEQGKVIQILSQQDPSLGQLLRGVSNIAVQKMRARSFHERVRPLMNQHRVDIRHFPNLDRYMSYLQLFSEISTSELLREVSGLETAIFEKLADDPDVIRLRDIQEKLKILKKYFSLKLKPEEFDQYQRNIAEFKTSRWITFINEKLKDLNLSKETLKVRPILDREQKRVAEFYHIAQERDYAFIERAFSKMEETGRDVAVFICGGYHTSHITALLKEDNTSYIVVTPHVLGETDMENYERILLGNVGTRPPA